MPPGRVQLLSPDAKRDLEKELAAISNRARQIATALNRDNLAVILPDDILLDIAAISGNEVKMRKIS